MDLTPDSEQAMRRYTRGEFLSLSAMLAGAASLAKLPFSRLNAQAPAPTSLPQRGAGIEADLVVVNGRVITMDAAAQRAEALAVKDGRFLAIGSTADVRNLASARTRVIDAAGMCIVPGFIDAHCHPSGVNELYGVVVTSLKTRRVDRGDAEEGGGDATGILVEGRLFDDTKLTDASPSTGMTSTERRRRT
jgi:hypothetical protein